MKEETAQDILTRLSRGEVTYDLFHKASMETFHNLFHYWRKFSNFRYTPMRVVCLYRGVSFCMQRLVCEQSGSYVWIVWEIYSNLDTVCLYII